DVVVALRTGRLGVGVAHRAPQLEAVVAALAAELVDRHPTPPSMLPGTAEGRGPARQTGCMPPTHPDTFGARTTMRVGSRDLTIFALDAARLAPFGVDRLPYSIKVLLENLLRHEDGGKVTAAQVEA